MKAYTIRGPSGLSDYIRYQASSFHFFKNMIPMRTRPVHLAIPGALEEIIVIPSSLGSKKRQHGRLGHRLQQSVAPGAIVLSRDTL